MGLYTLVDSAPSKKEEGLCPPLRQTQRQFPALHSTANEIVSDWEGNLWEQIRLGGKLLMLDKGNQSVVRTLDTVFSSDAAGNSLKVEFHHLVNYVQ